MNYCGSAIGRSTNFRSMPHHHAAVLLEYSGKSALNIVGPGSYIVYRFDRAGARALVDQRDLIYFAQIPVLRRVR